MLCIQTALNSLGQLLYLRHDLNQDFEGSILKILICTHSPVVSLTVLSLFDC